MDIRKIIKKAVTAVLLTVMCGSAQAGNIDATNKYAWSENTGWLNFNPADSDVTVYADHLEGYAWNENIGWIRLGTFTAGTAHTYANTASAADYGVNNNGSGTLSGYGWSENAGWIKFNPAGGGVTIAADGSFDGYAWAENIGWIHFKNASPAYNVAMTCMKGDVDGDKDITLKDAVTVLKILTSVKTDAPALCADVDGDGKIGMAEAVYILAQLL